MPESAEVILYSLSPIDQGSAPSNVICVMIPTRLLTSHLFLKSRRMDEEMRLQLRRRRRNGDPYNPFVVSHSERSKFLESKFGEFNGLYFDGKLPKYTVLLCSKPKSYGHEVAGYCTTGRRRIIIRNGMGKNSTIWTLVHEMAHAKFPKLKKVHGKQFASELARLRRLGAPLSPLDIDRQRIPVKNASSRDIRKLIEEALLVEKIPRKSVPKFLERELSLPISIIEKRIRLKSAIQEIVDRERVSSG
ncbi:MAG: hypothetical protein JRN20_03125 [Nitrososphaerota archaeon]|nr:hypothetical protein [Nitrososphaerota archaeon]MDG6921948.1 hypothetical protein [Nitrososphaerota archaeon]